MKHPAWAIYVLQAEETRKGPWTVEEDLQLIRSINLHGERRWNGIAKAGGLSRTGKSCRMRWVNYLRPGLKHGHISPDEERLILDLHARWGNRWSRIARRLPGRTDNEIKNYWRTHIKKKAEADDGSCSNLANNTSNPVRCESSLTSSASTTTISCDPENAASTSSSTIQITQDIFDMQHMTEGSPQPTLEQIDITRSEHSAPAVWITKELNEDQFGLQHEISDDGKASSPFQERLARLSLFTDSLSQDVSSSGCTCMDSLTAMMSQQDDFYEEYCVQAQQLDDKGYTNPASYMADFPDCLPNSEPWQYDCNVLWNLDDGDHQK